MSGIKKAGVCVAMVLAVGLLASAASAALLDSGTPYTDQFGTTWEGTAHFWNPTTNLKGHIDWIVYGKGDFPYGDSGYQPPADQYTYAFQIVNDGAKAISFFTFSVDQVVGNINSFISPGRVVGQPVSWTDIASGQGGFVEWHFDPLTANPPGLGEIDLGQSSAGLVFTSPKAPELTTTGRITNSGSSAGVDSLPAPGPRDIPEPSTFILLAAAMGFVVLGRRGFRR